jgi:hypothetical protein
MPSFRSGEDAFEGLPGASPRKFSTTRWSLVLTAGQGTTSEAHEALSTLCRLYWYPLRAEIAQTVERPEDVDDEIRLLLAALG